MLLYIMFWEGKMEVVSEEFTLATDKGGQEKVKEGPFCGRLTVCKEEIFTICDGFQDGQLS